MFWQRLQPGRRETINFPIHSRIYVYGSIPFPFCRRIVFVIRFCFTLTSLQRLSLSSRQRCRCVVQDKQVSSLVGFRRQEKGQNSDGTDVGPTTEANGDISLSAPRDISSTLLSRAICQHLSGACLFAALSLELAFLCRFTPGG
jgi:hypothetical protein